MLLLLLLLLPLPSEEEPGELPGGEDVRALAVAHGAGLESLEMGAKRKLNKTMMRRKFFREVPGDLGPANHS